MKNYGLLAVIAVSTIASSVSAAPTKSAAKSEAKWQPDFKSALAEAKKTGKPILADFHTVWCSPCHYMDRVTFKDPKFVAASKNWVLVKIDAENGKANVDLAAKHKVVAFPTLLFFKSNGQIADREPSIKDVMTAKPVVKTPEVVARMKTAYAKAK